MYSARVRLAGLWVTASAMLLTGSALGAGEPQEADDLDELLKSEPSKPVGGAPVDTAVPSAETPAPTPIISTPQDSPPAGKPTTSRVETPNDSRRIEEIVVTATKREQSLAEIPATITAIPGEELEQRGVQGVEDIVKLVPGVNLTSTGDGPPRVTIRGISSDVGTSSTTGAIFGDVSFTDAYVPFVSLDPNPFDLKDVEVLKGPQGTLFGASNLNGAIRYVPEPPKFGQWQTRYFAQETSIGGSPFKPTYGAAVNIPIGDKVAVRLVGFERSAPGYVDNNFLGLKDTNHTNQAGARGLLGWQPTEDWDIGLTYAWQNTHVDDTFIADNGNGDLSSSNRPRLSPNRTNYNLADVTLKYKFDWAQVVSDTAYVHKSAYKFFDASERVLSPPPFPLDAQVYTANSSTYSQELRLVSRDDLASNWSWVAGGLAFRQHIRNTLTVPLAVDIVPLPQLIPILNQAYPGLGSILTPDGVANVEGAAPDVTVTEHALFGEVTRKLFDRVEITLGGRFYQTKSGGTNTFSGIATLAETLMPERVLVGEIKEKGFNPKASIELRVDDNIRTYVTASKGYRVGGIQVGASVLPNPQHPVPDAFKSDTIWNYETGVRTEWLDSTLKVDATLFFERWKRPQIVQADQTNTSVYIDNVGGVKSKGAEVSLQYLFPLPGLMFTFGGGYTDTVTTKEFTASNGNLVEPGARWPLSPKFQTVSTLAFGLPIYNVVMTSAVTHTYLSSAVSDLAQRNPIFNYQQLDALVSFKYGSIPWLPELTISGSNLLDKRGIVNEFYSPVSNVGDYTYIAPRTINIRLGGRF